MVFTTHFIGMYDRSCSTQFAEIEFRLVYEDKIAIYITSRCRKERKEKCR
jgi:hypothetical protein